MSYARSSRATQTNTTIERAYVMKLSKIEKVVYIVFVVVVILLFVELLLLPASHSMSY